MTMKYRNTSHGAAYLIEQALEGALGNTSLYLYSGSFRHPDSYGTRTNYTSSEIAIWTESQTSFTIAYETDSAWIGLNEASSVMTVDAQRSGVISWFALVLDGAGSCFMTGTVSEMNGTGDLWVTETSAVSGQPVSLADFEFRITDAT